MIIFNKETQTINKSCPYLPMNPQTEPQIKGEGYVRIWKKNPCGEWCPAFCKNGNKVHLACMPQKLVVEIGAEE